MSPILALLSGAVCLSGAAALGVSAILGEQKQRRRFNDRLHLVAAPYMRTVPLLEMGRAAPGRSARTSSVIAAAARVFAYDPAHADHYSTSWWVVLIVALVLARGIAELLSIFAGTWSLLLVPVTWVMLSRYAFH